MLFPKRVKKLALFAFAGLVLAGSTTAFAADPDQGSIARGGKLYDKWYKVVKAEAPKESHCPSSDKMEQLAA